MADIQHSVITDPFIHEPKGVSSAAINSVYVANGGGGGNWEIITSNTVVVSTEADFPTPSAGVITLLSNTDYLVITDLTTSNRFILSEDTLLRATDNSQVLLTYTGSGDMFTSVDASNKIADISISCPSARLFNVSSSSGTDIFQLVQMIVLSCDKIGVSSGMFGTSVTEIRFLDVASDGIQFVGSHSLFTSATELVILSSGSLFDLGAATFDTFSYASSIVMLGGGASVLSGATGSANINAGGLGTVLNTRIQGGSTPLIGISVDDALWQFSLNDDIADTRADGLVSNTAGVTVAIASASIPVKVAGTWNSERSSQMTAGADGTVTYVGGKPVTTPINISMSLEPVSGTNKDFTLYVAINGSVINNSGQLGRASSGTPANVAVLWQSVLQPTDFVEAWIANETDTVDFQVNHAVIRVN